jgi:hypothetical protein
LRRDPGFREHLDNLYRQTSLASHLPRGFALPLSAGRTAYRSGERNSLRKLWRTEWYNEFEETQQLDVQKRIQRETLIAEEGTQADHLLLIRSGFARLSERQGSASHVVLLRSRSSIWTRRNFSRIGKLLIERNFFPINDRFEP